MRPMLRVFDIIPDSLECKLGYLILPMFGFAFIVGKGLLIVICLILDLNFHSPDLANDVRLGIQLLFQLFKIALLTFHDLGAFSYYIDRFVLHSSGLKRCTYILRLFCILANIIGNLCIFINLLSQVFQLGVDLCDLLLLSYYTLCKSRGIFFGF